MGHLRPWIGHADVTRQTPPALYGSVGMVVVTILVLGGLFGILALLISLPDSP
jgi:hypothetical protein